MEDAGAAGTGAGADLSTREAITARLATLRQHEQDLSDSLALVVADTRAVELALDGLHTLEPDAGAVARQARKLRDDTLRVARTAERVGGKVRVLDEQQVRSPSLRPSLFCS